MIRLDNITYPPEPICTDDLMPEDLPDALTAWETECNEITIKQLQDEKNLAEATLVKFESLALEEREGDRATIKQLQNKIENKDLVIGVLEKECEGRDEIIKQLQAELEETEGALIDTTKLFAETVDKYRWIPITERLPEKGQYVFVLSKYGKGNIFVIFWQNQYIITHWMPVILPNLDKELAVQKKPLES